MSLEIIFSYVYYIMKLKKYEQEKKAQYNCFNLNPCVNVNKNLNFPTMHVDVNKKLKVKVFYLIL